MNSLPSDISTLSKSQWSEEEDHFKNLRQYSRNDGSTNKSPKKSVDSPGSSGQHTPLQVKMVESLTSESQDLAKRLIAFSRERLDFSKGFRLYGREKEIVELEKLVEEKLLPEEKSAKSRDRCFLFVKGDSGCGKTILVDELNRIIVKSGGLYCKGKFDIHDDRPLYPIKAAMRMLIAEIFKQPPAVYKEIEDQISQELSSEIFLLARFIPDILTLAGKESSSKDISSKDDGRNESIDQFNYAARKLMEIITTVMPVVLVIDDLQWSDPASIQLMKTWIADVELKSLMIAGICRTVKNSHNDGIAQMLEDIERISEERSIAFKTISLGNLNESAIDEFLVDVLRTDLEAVHPLSYALMKKTGGNPFAMKQFLLTLLRQNLLTYNIGLTKWSWDVDGIRKLSVSENIAELITSRFYEIKAARRVLPAAACLGSTVSVATLEIIQSTCKNSELISEDPSLFDLGSVQESEEMSMSSRYLQDSLRNNIHDDLQQCAEEGFIEFCGDEKFMFVHDKVQEAALRMLQDHSLVRFRLGEILLSMSDEEQLDDCLFEIIGLLKTKPDIIAKQTDERRFQLAHLFYRGGKKAHGMAAYRAAGDYFKLSIDLVSFDTWRHEQDFCLDLYSTAAEAEYNDGRFEQLQVYASRLMQHVESTANCGFHETLRVSYAIIQVYASILDKNEEAVVYAVETLAKLGCKLPSSKTGVLFAAAKGLLSCKRSAQKVTSEFLDNLPIVTDPVQVGIMKILDACVFPFYSVKPEYLPLIAVEMNRVTMKHGITPYAAYSFCFLGFIFTHFFGDLETGRKFADHSFALFEKYGFQEIEPKTTFMIYSTLWHWTNPLANNLKKFYDIYQRGMRVGDSATGFTSAFYYLEAALYAGRKLESIDEDLVNYLKHTVDFKQEKVATFMEPLLQCVRNLRGKSRNTTTLTGMVMDENEKLDFYNQRNDSLLLSHVYKRKLFLCVVFGEFDLGADIATREGSNMLKAQIGQISVPVIAFHASLCCLAVARDDSNKNNKRHSKLGRKYRRMIKKWSKNNPNCIFYLKMLDAEKAALLGKYDEAINGYERVITLTGRSGMTLEQALANERLGTIHLGHGNISDGKYRFNKSIELYHEWGSTAKTRKLQKHVDTLEDDASPNIIEC